MISPRMYSFILLLQNLIFMAQQRIDFQRASWMAVGGAGGWTKTVRMWEGSAGAQEGDGMDGQRGIGGRESAQAWEKSALSRTTHASSHPAHLSAARISADFLWSVVPISILCLETSKWDNFD